MPPLRSGAHIACLHTCCSSESLKAEQGRLHGAQSPGGNPTGAEQGRINRFGRLDYASFDISA